MLKWLVYLSFVFMLAPMVSSATPCKHSPKNNLKTVHHISLDAAWRVTTDWDTVKIKKVAKSRNLPKPEKIDIPGDSLGSRFKIKLKRQRRPDGLERPPEIPRRNGN